MDVWEECGSSNHIQSIQSTCWRLVETQSSCSTRILVSSAAAHERLETILDEGKPSIQLHAHEQKCKSLHYLLLTPFRYPPLKHGSRFGAIYQRGIFYASSKLETAAAETAFYRMYFAKGSEGKIGNKNQFYTAFMAKVRTNMALDLTKGAFDNFKHAISSKTSYKTSQDLGKRMRKENIELFLSYSARANDNQLNYNILSPLAFDLKHKLTDTFEDWVCFYTKEYAEIYQKKDPKNTKLIFFDRDFFSNGKFPQPAS